MTEEKMKPAEDEVSEEQLEDVSGGIIIINSKSIIDDNKTMKSTEPIDQKLTEPLDKNILER